MIEQVTAVELKRRLDAGELLAVLDVREPDERDYCRIFVPPATIDMHIPLRQVPVRLAELRELTGNRPIVVYCHHGVRSMVAASWMVENGMTGVLNLDRGIDSWSSEADPSVPRY